jgi:pseudouridine-5'-phosphate glycosidase
LSKRIVVQATVAKALGQKAPLVALGPTLISHGLPYPDNVELAREVEELVRCEGAVPATIGVIGGIPKVGLEPAELELIASGGGVPKLSVRDIPIAVAKKSHGATQKPSRITLEIVGPSNV